tara:strand:+ start:748 stop:2670 length:1923 start_codon:yes stop_codon:yes gene_type:complete
MCSILGIIDFKKNFHDKKKIIRKLNSLMSHRGPDDEGYYEEENVSLAFNRLSIIDLKNGNQPIIFKNIISIFNGEIYNYRLIKSELISNGYKFKTNCDSEIIPLAYDFWGKEFVKKLDGMFAISIYDKKLNQLLLFRDRSGIKPLYYYQDKKYFIFSSELKGIINLPDFKKELSQEALFSYLCFRYPMDDNNIFFKRIKRVTPGTYLILNLNSTETKKYNFWEIPSFSNPFLENKTHNELIEDLDRRLNQSVKDQMISDVPVGVFLSGGLDSSLLTALMTKFSKDKINSFSVSFEEENYDEGDYADLVSKQFNTIHHKIVVTQKEFMMNIENAIKVKDTPLSIPHEYALYALSKKMKGIVKVVLSGEGADEHFGGYSRVQFSPFDFLKGNFIQEKLNFEIIHRLLNLDHKFDYSKKNFINFFLKQYKWFSLEEAKRMFLNHRIEKLDFKSINDLWSMDFKKTKNEKTKYYDQVLFYFQKNHLPCLLDRLDIMTMANSIEARVPFLDHNLIKFVNSLKFSSKINWNSKFSKFLSIFSKSEIYSEHLNTNKYLLRKLGKKYLAKKIYNRKKLGFPLPMNQWMNNDFVKDNIIKKNSLLSEMFKKEELDSMINKLNTKNDLYDFSGKKIWMLLNLQLWGKIFL